MGQDNSKETSQLSKAAFGRIPGYLLYLSGKRAEGVEYISSTVISSDLNQNPVQVRKDLAFVSEQPGKPKMGFKIDELIDSMEKFLGYRDANQSILVGVGQLGKTLMSYSGFAAYGLKIVAGFDTDETLDGTVFRGKKIYAFDKLEPYVRRNKIRMGIITVPKDAAQSVADCLVKAGIRAIWNFAPAHLVLPEKVAVKNEDMAASLALLSLKLKEQGD